MADDSADQLTTSLVLDTDIGTDVDDVLALATILGSPELVLDGVTTVYGDVLLRARMVARVARVAGRPVGPIVPGRSETRSGRPVWWPGHEGRLLDGLDREQVAADMDPIDLLESAQVVAAIGPLTNIAEASVRELYVMGCAFRGSGGRSPEGTAGRSGGRSPEGTAGRSGGRPPEGTARRSGGRSLEGTADGRVEHNVRCDVTAAAAVFRSGCRATVIGLEQTERVRLGGSVVERIEETGEFGRLLAAEMRQFWRFIDGDSNVPHDPLAILMITNPELFGFATGRITVDEGDGGTTFAPEPDGPHRIVTDLDPDLVAREIVSRVLAACAHSNLASVQGDLP